MNRKLKYFLLGILIVSFNLNGFAKAKNAKQENSYDVIVIGAGMGGLSTAATLTNLNKKVLLIEQNPYHVGGCTCSFEKKISNDNFTFEAAMHQTGIPPLILEQLGIKYNVIGDTLAKKYKDPDITFFKFGKDTIDELYDVIVDNGKTAPFIYHLPANINDIETQLINDPKFSKESKAINQFFDYVNFHFTHKINSLAGLLNVLNKKINDKEKSEKVMDAVFNCSNSPYIFSSMDNFLDSINLNNKELRTILSQYWMYGGPPPSQQWAPFVLLMLNGYSSNCMQVVGTSQALANMYEKYIKSHGGEIHLGEKALKINFNKSKDGTLFVTGVTTDKGVYNSKYVVSTADPFQTFYNPETGKDGLIGKINTPITTKEIIENTKVSNSLFDIYLPLDKTYKELGIPENKYELFYQSSFNADKCYKLAMKGNNKNSLGVIVLYSNLSKYENNFRYAPEGKSELVISCYANPNDSTWWTNSDDSEIIQNRAQDAVEMAKKCLADIAKQEHLYFDQNAFDEAICSRDANRKIVYILGTPGDTNKFTMQYKGIPYGWNMTNDQFYKRIMIKNQIKGLFLAGSWTLPSHGIEPAQISGFICGWWIFIEDFISKFRHISSNIKMI